MHTVPKRHPTKLFGMVMLTAAWFVSAESGICAFGAAAKLTISPDLAIETRTLIQLFETSHFPQQAGAPAYFETIVDDFMSDLDGERLFFLEGDRVSLRQQFGSESYSRLASGGDLSTAVAIFEVYQKRVRDRVEWISSELKADYNFFGDETYKLDRSAAAWPADAQAADELWHRRLKHELLAELPSDNAINQAKSVVGRRYQGLLVRTDAMDESSLASRFLEVVARSFDSQSKYYSPQMLSGLTGSPKIVGIGLAFSATAEGCRVSDIVPGGPAAMVGGIEVGDIIVSVAQESGLPVDIYGFDSNQIVSLLRGKSGSVVRLTIRPAYSMDPSERKTITLRRGSVPADRSRAFADIVKIPSNGKTMSVGVVHLRTFYGPTNGDSLTAGSVSSEVDALLAGLQRQNVEGIVLDLRGNTGGFFDEAVEVAGLFLGPRLVARVKEQKGRVIDATPRVRKPTFTGPLAVLVDRTTASGAEIVVGALQIYGRAVIVGGNQTCGAGSLQQIFELRQYLPGNKSPTGVAKITTGIFFPPQWILNSTARHCP